MVKIKLNKIWRYIKASNWNNSLGTTNEIEKFTKSCHTIISELAYTVNKLKTFVGKIDAIFKDWFKIEKKLFQKPSIINEADAVSKRFNAYYDQERSKMANKIKDISNLFEVYCRVFSLSLFCSVKLLLEERNIEFRPAFKDRKTIKWIFIGKDKFIS